MSNLKLSTFWDEEKKRSEFHFEEGRVLYGSNKDTMALLVSVTKLMDEVSGLKRSLAEINELVGRELGRWVWP